MAIGSDPFDPCSVLRVVCDMVLNGVEIEDTFAEAFPMTGARAVITAETAGWARTAAAGMTGYATSVIG